MAGFFRTHRFLIASFVVPFCLRAIPEVMAGAYPIGYDSIASYVPLMKDWAGGNISEQFSPLIGGWLLYLVLGYSYTLTQVDPILILKISSPLLYAFLGLSEYWFGTKTLAWSPGKSCFLASLCSSYFVSLRLSWDLLRNVLGLTFLLLTIASCKRVSSYKEMILYSFLLFLTVTAHVLTGALAISISTLEAIIAGTQGVRRLLSVIPAALVFGSSLLSTNGAGIPLLVMRPTSDFTSYWFIGYIFLPLLPIALLGGRSVKAHSVKLWLFVCICGIIAATTPISINSELLSPERWSLLLFLPLGVYASEGFCNLSGRHFQTRLPMKALGKIWISILLFLSATYIVLPAGSAFLYYSSFAPTSMMQSTVPVEDSQDVIASFHWLSSNMAPNAILMTTDPMYGWAKEFFAGTEPVLRFAEGVTLGQGLQSAIKQGYSTIYTVWWADGKGWYGQSIPPQGFMLEQKYGDFGVFLYSTTP